MLVLVLGYVGFWLALSFLLGFVIAVCASGGEVKRSGEEDITVGAFVMGTIMSLAITILIVSCRIIF